MTTGGVPTRISITTGSNSSDRAERLTVKASGNVGIGDTTPASMFTVGNGDLFQVNSSGAIAASTGITTTGNINLSGTSANVVLGSNWLSGDGADEGVFVASSGNVGVGTAIPATLFHVSSTNPAMLFENTGTGGRQWGFFSSKDSDSISGGKLAIYDRTTSTSVATSHRFVIDSAGNVGIGTFSPSNKLDIVQDANTSARVQFANPHVGTAAFASWALSNATNQNDGLELRVHGTGYTSSGAFLQDSALVMAGSNVSGGLSIVTREASANMRFYTGGVTDADERMRITSDGKVGIGTGTSTPSTLLHVYNRATSLGATDNLIRIESDITNSRTSHIGYGTTGSWFIRSVLSTGSVNIQDQGGNVGIGTSTPQYELDVDGDIGVHGLINFGNGMCQGEDTGTTTPNVTIQACADF